MRQLSRSPKTLENKEEEKKRNVDESEKISRGGNFQGPTRHLHRRVFDELLKQQIRKNKKTKEGEGKRKGKRRRKMWNKTVSSFVFHDVAGQLDLVLLARTPFSFVSPFQNSSFLSHPCTRTRMERMLTRPNERAHSFVYSH